MIRNRNISKICNVRSGRLYRWLIFSLSVAILSSCASIVSPSGGPKDTTPPDVVAAEPASGSVAFAGHSFTLSFSEYIQISNLQQQMLVSPPLATQPKFRLRGKSLRVSFSDTLLPNTTYSFFFGDAIKDITENNPMVNYSYFLATGSFIDSLSLEGTVSNAWDNKVEEGLIVMLYESSVSDSAFALKKPRYITRPDKSGKFSFKHLSDGSYHLVAVADLNNNMLYDLPTEPVAFYPEMVTPVFQAVRVADTIADTLAPPPAPVVKRQHHLKMFVGEDSIQRVQAARSEGRNSAFITFRYPVTDFVNLTITDSILNSITAIKWNEKKDSLFIWLKEHTRDSLPLIITDRNFADTLAVQLRPLPVPARGRVAQKTLYFTMNVIRGGKIHPAVKPELRFNMPLTDFIPEGSLLISPEDTLPLELIPADTSFLFRFVINNNLEPDVQYTIIIPPGMCRGWDGSVNDSLEYSFGVDLSENYGTITVKVATDSLPEGDILLLLLNDKSDVLETRVVTNDNPEQFTLLKPGNYKLKAVLDLNRNGRWDTGDYWKRQQPEPTLMLATPVSLRANWEEEVEWKIEF